MVSQSKTLAYSSDPMPTCDVQLLLGPVITQARVNRAKTVVHQKSGKWKGNLKVSKSTRGFIALSDYPFWVRQSHTIVEVFGSAIFIGLLVLIPQIILKLSQRRE